MSHSTDPEQPPQPDSPQVYPPMIYVFEGQTWEYKSIARDVGRGELLSDEELSALGAEGWELAGVASLPQRVTYYFKRPRD